MTFADGTRLSFSFSPAPWFTPQTAVLSCWWWRIHHLHRTGLERKLQKWHFIRLGSRLVLESKVRLKVLKIFKERRINVDAKNVRPCSLPNCVNSSSTPRSTGLALDHDHWQRSYQKPPSIFLVSTETPTMPRSKKALKSPTRDLKKHLRLSLMFPTVSFSPQQSLTRWLSEFECQIWVGDCFIYTTASNRLLLLCRCCPTASALSICELS